MSLKYESPTGYVSDNSSLYSMSDNESRLSSTNSTPYKSSPTASIPLTTTATVNINNNLSSNFNTHQEFLNVIQARQLQNSNTGWIIPPSFYHHCHQHIEDLAPIESQILNNLMLKNNKNQLLLIDVRSFNYFLKNRIKSAINVSIPSFLLKRTTYTIDKVCESITYDDEAVDRLKNWSTAINIVFYDHSSYKRSESGISATAILLGSKLRKVGYKGQLNYLQGGFNTFSELYSNQCEMIPLEETNKNKKSRNIKKQNRPTSITLPLPTAAESMVNDNYKTLAMNPFFSNIRQNLELSHGPLKERFEVRLPCGLQYKDGIITTTVSSSYPTANNIHHPRFGLAGSSVDKNGNFQLPIWMRNIMNTENGPKMLAEMYEKLERTEQKRLSTIMNYHSRREATLVKQAANDEDVEMTENNHFPFSITSSMEKGALNRYDNIWPYDYSRVKLCKNEDDDDYINANYIQYADIKKDITLSPISQSNEEIKLQADGLLSQASIRTMNRINVDLDCNRQYISTQGPLPTTFNNFWKLIWDENSFVIVMLTQEMEMNKIKCHRYWPSNLNVPQTYGSSVVTLLSELKQSVINMNDKRERAVDDIDDDLIIIRKFSLKHGNEERTITHLQYTGWTDFGVPDQPVGILQLVHQADEAAASFSNSGPMIVHCSAGCGRSGTFCAIDTIIQRLSHERDVYTCTSSDKIVETVGRFREERMSMVQTHRQFVFCYEAILWWLLGYGYLPASSFPCNNTFSIPKITPMNNILSLENSSFS